VFCFNNIPELSKKKKKDKKKIDDQCIFQTLQIQRQKTLRNDTIGSQTRDSAFKFLSILELQVCIGQ
jgi:hypothetical protein